MKKRFYFLTALVIAVFGMSFMSCSDDDNVPADFESYILGTWKSYKAVVYIEDETATIGVSKTGQASASYMEFTFKEGGTGNLWLWEQDNSGVSRWTEEKLRYSVNGNTVNVYDDDGEPLQLLYDEKHKSLYLRMVTKIDYEDATIYLYFKK